MWRHRPADRRPWVFADRLLPIPLWIAAGLSSSIVLVIFAVVLVESVPAIIDVGFLRLIVDDGWFPTSGSFGMAQMLVGSVAVMLGAGIIAVPIGILSAIFMVFYAPGWLVGPYQRLLELLAGIPSVVFGFWGLTTLVPLIARIQGPGTSLLAACLVLALMILPTVNLLSFASLKAVPGNYYRGGIGLGLPRFRTIYSIVVPTARGGIATACILALARALGETMAVVMVAGNIVRFPTNPLAPVRTLSANIVLEIGYAVDTHRSALFAGTLVLILAVAIVFSVGRSFGTGETR